jgi:hypothetical protein
MPRPEAQRMTYDSHELTLREVGARCVASALLGDTGLKESHGRASILDRNGR